MQLEQMSDFFARRLNSYDAHMLGEVEGCQTGYRKMAELLPGTIESLLDLGCGTGLELKSIFERFPCLAVTGIDLTEAMLDKLKEKYAGKNISLILGSYIGRDFGREQYDAAVSFETMHHMSHTEKISVYTSVQRALKIGGVYIECDYMLTSQQEEDALYSENARLRKEQHIPDGAFYHFDIPCTIENQIKLLLQSGFQSAENVWRKGNTTMIVSKK